MAPPTSPRLRTLSVLALVLCLPPWLGAQDKPKEPEKIARPEVPDLARVKEQEAREKLERLEEAMDRLSRLLGASEPHNAAKLRLAFQQSRERLLREGMDRIVLYLKEKKLDRAIAEQGQVKVNLEEILAILLEQDIDPREILKHIRRLRDLVQGLDKVIKDETSEKMASDDANQSGATSDALAGDLERLEDLIRREKGLEKETRDPEKTSSAGSRGKLEGEQSRVRRDTAALREGDAARGEKPVKPGPDGRAEPSPGNPSGAEGRPGRPGEPRPGGQPDLPRPPTEPGETDPGAGNLPPDPGRPGEPTEREPPPPQPESVLEKQALARAEEAMAAAEEALKGGQVPRAAARTTEARERLEEAVASGKDRLERLRAQRDFKGMTKDQDATKSETDTLAEKMAAPPPLVGSPEEGVPGRSDVQSASEDMQGASGNLAQGKAGKASGSQSKALSKLKKGRERTEEALEELQRALRDRLLSYLREKFTRMLNEQRAVSRETRSLDLRLRALKAVAGATVSLDPSPEIDRKDRQTAEALAARETGLILLADDVIDLLAEDGTTLVFPGVVEEVKGDILNVSGLLSRIQTGERTQYVQREIEVAIEEILKALEVAQKSPPPPNPNQGRSSKSGAGPLLPMSSELKMVRSLQLRVNERTAAFDLKRKAEVDLTPEEKLQVSAIARKQKEVEAMMRKLREAMGEE